MQTDDVGKYWVTDAELSVAEACALVAAPGHGAIATFSGTVRTPSGGRSVVGILYEAYAEMAEEKLAQIGKECADQFGAGRVALAHRTGELKVGDTSVVIAVGAERRRSALDACGHAIERIKEILPVWKKERFEDGSTWVGWGGAPTPALEKPHQERSSES
jgi:molybdopterin synthase catalytic subunit